MDRTQETLDYIVVLLQRMLDRMPDDKPTGSLPRLKPTRHGWATIDPELSAREAGEAFVEEAIKYEKSKGYAFNPTIVEPPPDLRELAPVVLQVCEDNLDLVDKFYKDCVPFTGERPIVGIARALRFVLPKCMYLSKRESEAMVMRTLNSHKGELQMKIREGA